MNLLEHHLEPTPPQLSPPVQLTQLKHRGKTFYIAREDLLPGGTKQRAVAHFVRLLTKQGYSHIVYASPFCGYAQVALSYVCQILHVHCTIVAESDPHSVKFAKHKYTRLAETYGANIILVKSLFEAEEKATRFALLREEYYQAPLGFDCPDYKNFLKIELLKQWNILHSHLKIHSIFLFWPAQMKILFPKQLNMHTVWEK